MTKSSTNLFSLWFYSKCTDNILVLSLLIKAGVWQVKLQNNSELFLW
jgi:hypothetical protein